MAVIPAIEVKLTLADYEARRLSLGPDDVVVVQCGTTTPTEAMVRIKALAESVFPDNKVIVLGGGAQLEVVTPTLEVD